MSRHTCLPLAAVLLPLVVVAQNPPQGWRELKFGQPTGNTINVSAAALRSEGVSIRTLISFAHDFTAGRIAGPALLDSERYSLSALPEQEGLHNMRDLLREVLANQFQLKTRRESRTVPVYVLKVVPKQPAKLAAAAGERMNVGQGTLTGYGPLIVLIRQLEPRLGRPVLDDTGLAGGFHYELKWEPGNRQSLMNSLPEQLGLELVHDERPVEMLVVDRVEALRVTP